MKKHRKPRNHRKSREARTKHHRSAVSKLLPAVRVGNDISMEVAALQSALSQLTLPEIETALLPLEQAECPVIHRFGPGVYIREVSLPAGILAVGHVQRCSQMNVFLSGRVLMLNDNGTTTELAAPMIFTGPPGRKMGIVMEDVVWLNIYATDETDVATLEETYLDKSPEWTAADQRRFDQAGPQWFDIADFHQALKDIGVSAQTVQEQTDVVDDQIPMPFGDFKIMITRSHINGKGVFATAAIEQGEIIGPARISGYRTPIGRYVNHAKVPNAEIAIIGRDVYVRALAHISGAKAGFAGDEITMDYRNNIKVNQMAAAKGESCQG